MLIAASSPAFDLLIALFWFVLFVLLVASVVMMYFVIWSRVDWDVAVRTVATIVASLGLLLPMVGVSVYGIVDVLTRPKVTTGSKVGFVIGLVFLGPIGWFIYFVWALRHKPDPVEAPTPAPALTPSGSKELSAADLDYLEKLADLHDKGVLSDEQYEEQRKRALGESDHT